MLGLIPYFVLTKKFVCVQKDRWKEIFYVRKYILYATVGPDILDG